MVCCRTLQDLKTDTVITTVDAIHKRTATFFRLGDSERIFGTGFGTHERQFMGIGSQRQASTLVSVAT